MKESNEFLNVPVPRQHVTKVYELVARLETSGHGDSSAEPASNGAASGLTQALVNRMYRESWDPHKRLMEYLADRPDQWIGTREIAEALGLEHGSKSLAGSLGAFGRRAEHRYGGLKPWESRWSSEGQAQHRMSQEVAAWIKQTAS